MKLPKWIVHSVSMFSVAATLMACEDGGLSVVKGNLVVPEKLDFGAVLIDTTVHQQIKIENHSVVPAIVTGISTDSAFPAQFVVDPTPFTIEPHDSRLVDVAFHVDSLAQLEGTVTFLVESGTVGVNLSTVITGQGVKAVALPSPTEIDFGLISVFDHANREVTITNSGRVPVTAEISGLTGIYSSHFAVGTNGPIQVPAGGSVPIRVEFNPTAQAVMEATFNVTPCPGCAVVPVTLKGTSVGVSLDFFPRMLDFGFLQPGSTDRKGVKIRNIGSLSVLINRVELLSTTDPAFTVDTAANGVAISSGSELDVNVTFAPTDFRSYSGTLKIYTNDPIFPELLIPISGSGGGPIAHCTPTNLNFGSVVLGTQKTMQVVCSNRGTDSGMGNSALQITGVSITGSSMFHATIPQTLSILPGNTFGLDVLYWPLAGGIASGKLLIQTNDASHPTYEVDLSALAQVAAPCQYSVTPTFLNFNRVRVGASAQLAFKLRNEGADFCAVTNLKLSAQSPSDTASHAGDFLLPQGFISNTSLAPGADLLIPVSFQPTQAGPAGGSVEFFVNGASGVVPGFVPLLAVGDLSCIEARPVFVDFGITGLNCPANLKELRLTNVCSQSVSVDSLGLDPITSPEFAITSPTTAFQIAGGSSTTVNLSYLPTDFGLDFGALQIIEPGQTQPLIVTLQGGATQAVSQTDHFAAEDATLQNKIDILFVIDNSGSMADEQALLAANFPTFIAGAVNNAWDFNIAVTTTDVSCVNPYGNCTRGSFFPLGGSDRIMNRNTPNLAGVFASHVSVGINGSPAESGLEASRFALSAPLISSTDSATGNAGFLRDEAKLAVIFVSDEEDNPAVNPVGVYQNFFTQLKDGRSDMVSVAAVVGTNSCTSAAAVFGARYIDLANAFSGVVEPICAPDWAPVLQNISQNLFAGRKRFSLSNTPSSSSIAVSVDGVQVPQTEPNGTVNWTYDAVNNQVVFTDPILRQTVDITYQVTCS